MLPMLASRQLGSWRTMRTFAPPDWQAAFANPTVRSTDPQTGHDFDATSPTWKNACAMLPSFAGLQWPGYATTAIETKINGRDVIIQPWMGNCEQFMGRTNFPGGTGGEVGVYVRVPPGRSLPDADNLPVLFKAALTLADDLDSDDLWWPDPEMQPEIDFTIIHASSRAVLLRASPERHYWLNKWMEPASYERWKAANPGSAPSSPTGFKMIYTVDNHTREWTPD